MPCGRLGRAGVVDGVVLEVLRHLLAGVEPLLDLGVRDVAGDDERPGERQPGLDRVLGELGEDVVHRLVEVDLDDDVAARRADADRVVLVLAEVDARVGKEAGRVGLELLEEDALGGDLAEHLPVGRARDRDGDGQRGAVAGEAHDPHVVAEVLAAELRADAELAGQLEHLLLELGVAEAVAGGRRRTSAACRGTSREAYLAVFEGELGARAADDDGEVVGRAGRRAERCAASRRGSASSRRR